MRIKGKKKETWTSLIALGKLDESVDTLFDIAIGIPLMVETPKTFDQI